MYAAWTLHKKAQVCPNSAGVPKRLAGISAMARAASADSGLPVLLAAAAKPPRKRWVSKLPGSRLLMVTFLSATLRATPAANAVRPAPPPPGQARPGGGDFAPVEGVVAVFPT